MSHRIFFYGSCVSRDKPRVVDASNRFAIGPYIARQSWISAFSSPTRLPATPSALKSKFQQKAVEADFSSSFPKRIREEGDHIDALLLALIDERRGMVPTSEGYVTNSYELANSKWKKEAAAGPTVDLSTEGHLELWKSASSELVALLSELDLMDRTFGVDVQYALSSKQGGDFSEKRYPPQLRNAQFQPYYEHLYEIGLNCLVMPTEVTRADRNHHWSLEAFHYIDEYYEYMAAALEHQLTA